MTIPYMAPGPRSVARTIIWLLALVSLLVIWLPLGIAGYALTALYWLNRLTKHHEWRDRTPVDTVNGAADVQRLRLVEMSRQMRKMR